MYILGIWAWNIWYCNCMVLKCLRFYNALQNIIILQCTNTLNALIHFFLVFSSNKYSWPASWICKLCSAFGLPANGRPYFDHTDVYINVEAPTINNVIFNLALNLRCMYFHTLGNVWKFDKVACTCMRMRVRDACTTCRAHATMPCQTPPFSVQVICTTLSTTHHWLTSWLISDIRDNQPIVYSYWKLVPDTSVILFITYFTYI